MDGNVQTLWNQEILNQLKKLGHRLDVLEKGECKKTKYRSKIKSTMSKNKTKVQNHDQSQVS